MMELDSSRLEDDGACTRVVFVCSALVALKVEREASEFAWMVLFRFGLVGWCC